jgi:hypothetical protein
MVLHRGDVARLLVWTHDKLPDLHKSDMNYELYHGCPTATGRAY